LERTNKVGRTFAQQGQVERFIAHSAFFRIAKEFDLAKGCQSLTVPPPPTIGLDRGRMRPFGLESPSESPQGSPFALDSGRSLPARAIDASQ
jgi:hypothetical protein